VRTALRHRGSADPTGSDADPRPLPSTLPHARERDSRVAASDAPGKATGAASVLAARPARPGLAALLVPLSGLVLLFVAACALLPGAIAPYLPTDMNPDHILSAPAHDHWFGTDQFGRDVLSLVVYGARQSLAIGIFSVLIGCGLGVSVGLLAGYAGGWIDVTLMRLIDVWMAVPNILLAIALSAVLGPGLFNTILAISLVVVPRYARVLRGQAMAVRTRAFIEAARAGGASHFAILRGHVLPHCVAPILVLATLGVGSSILIGAGLSFLGLGINDERPDWGYLLTQGRGYMTTAWWTVTCPGLAITLLVVSVNLLGDALRRRLDPRRVPR
jgi:peptide/nickel transport system permease protein